MEKDQLATMYTLIKDVISEHSNVAYYDFMADDRFSVDDFYDQDHLNESGADKFTKLLSDTIFCR